MQASDEIPQSTISTKAMAALFGVTRQRVFQLRAEGFAIMADRDAWDLKATLQMLHRRCRQAERKTRQPAPQDLSVALGEISL